MKTLMMFVVSSAVLFSACEVKHERRTRGGAARGNQKSFVLSWDAGEDNISDYAIHFGPSNDNVKKEVLKFQAIKPGFRKKEPSVTVAVNKDELSGGNACFTVTAINAAGPSTPSQPICVDLKTK